MQHIWILKRDIHENNGSDSQIPQEGLHLRGSFGDEAVAGIAIGRLEDAAAVVAVAAASLAWW